MNSEKLVMREFAGIFMQNNLLNQFRTELNRAIWVELNFSEGIQPLVEVRTSDEKIAAGGCPP